LLAFGFAGEVECRRSSLFDCALKLLDELLVFFPRCIVQSALLLSARFIILKLVEHVVRRSLARARAPAARLAPLRYLRRLDLLEHDRHHLLLLLIQDDPGRRAAGGRRGELSGECVLRVLQALVDVCLLLGGQPAQGQRGVVAGHRLGPLPQLTVRSAAVGPRHPVRLIRLRRRSRRLQRLRVVLQLQVAVRRYIVAFGARARARPRFSSAGTSFFSARMSIGSACLCKPSSMSCTACVYAGSFRQCVFAAPPPTPAAPFFIGMLPRSPTHSCRRWWGFPSSSARREPPRPLRRLQPGRAARGRCWAALSGTL